SRDPGHYAGGAATAVGAVHLQPGGEARLQEIGRLRMSGRDLRRGPGGSYGSGAAGVYGPRLPRRGPDRLPPARRRAVLPGSEPAAGPEPAVQRLGDHGEPTGYQPRPTRRTDSECGDGARPTVSAGGWPALDHPLRRTMPSPRILVLFNEPILPHEHPDAASEREILDTVHS